MVVWVGLGWDGISEIGIGLMLARIKENSIREIRFAGAEKATPVHTGSTAKKSQHPSRS